MKQLFDLHDKHAWDDEIPSHMIDWWIDVMTEAIKAEHLKFPRGTKPKKAFDEPILIGFCDGSLSGYAAVVYIRWGL